jgi:hypothetical protein
MENKKEIAFLFYFTYGSPLIFCDLFASSWWLIGARR